MRRHPLAFALAALVLLGGCWPLPPIVDAVTGQTPGDADLARPLFYVLIAPLSNLLDALTFLSLERAKLLLLTWVVLLVAWGLLRHGAWRERLLRAAAAVLGVLVIVLATLVLPRPVPSLESADSSATVIDFHAHSVLSHDGRRGWTLHDLAAWHERQGFQASYVTDHNVVFAGSTDQAIPLLPGVEWSVYRQHIVAIGPVQPIVPDSFSHDTPGMLQLFAELHRQGALGIASIPEYWEHHREDLDAFVAAGVDGFEIVNCAPKAIGFTPEARHDVVELAGQHDLLLTGASDNHGWGRVTCVWNVTHPGARGVHANHIFARPLALAQGTLAPWNAGVTQPWLMFRSLGWAERVSWLTWITVVLLYRAQPRRQGQRAGFGILARSV